MISQTVAESWFDTRAAAEERERLGGLLHDGVLQSLNVAAIELAHLKLELMAAADLSTTFPGLPFAEMLQISDALERQMRQVSGDVRGWFRQANDLPPASFAAGRQPDGNLPGALRWLVLQRLRFVLEEHPAMVGTTPAKPSGGGAANRLPPGEEVPTVHLRVQGGGVVLSAAVEAEVLAIVQEALLNAHRHGRAREILLTLDLEIGVTSATALKLVVLDDGETSPERFASPTDRAPQSGFGLRAMHGRAARLDATLSIAAAPLAGTLVCLEIPLRDSDHVIEI